MTPSELTPLPSAPPLRSKNPIFTLRGTLFHPIDDRSALFGKGEDAVAESGIRSRVGLTRVRETVAWRLGRAEHPGGVRPHAPARGRRYAVAKAGKDALGIRRGEAYEGVTTPLP
jgi:hypothetical protein